MAEPYLPGNAGDPLIAVASAAVALAETPMASEFSVAPN